MGGETLFRFQSFRFAAFPWMRGRAPELDAPDARQILGRSLARVHQLGAVRPFLARPQIGIQRLGVQARHQVLTGAMLPERLIDRYGQVSEILLKRVREAFEEVGRVGELRIHGDMHLGNLLWN